MYSKQIRVEMDNLTNLYFMNASTSKSYTDHGFKFNNLFVLLLKSTDVRLPKVWVRKFQGIGLMN